MNLKSFQDMANKLKEAMTLKVSKGEIKSFTIHLNGDDKKILVEINDNNGKSYDYTINYKLCLNNIKEATNAESFC